MIIGREGQQPFSITDRYVSKHHCDITKTATDGTFHIKDLGTPNHTYVNGLPIVQCNVTFKDKIVLGPNYSLNLADCFPPPPPPSEPPVFPYRLRKIYDDYTEQELKLKRIQRNKINIRMLFTMVPGIISFALGKVINQDILQVVGGICSIIGFILLLTMLLGSDETDKKLKSLMNQFQQTYVDGNCNRFLGNSSPDYIQNNLKCQCPYCRKKII